jgi:hypothetical protein
MRTADFDIPSVTSKKRKASEVSAAGLEEAGASHQAKYRKTNEQTQIHGGND